MLNLIDIAGGHTGPSLVDLAESAASEGIYLVQLWEDVWHSRREQVLGRIAAIIGTNKRLHGRQTKIVQLTQSQMDEFLNQHHLLGTAKSKYRFGLVHGDKLVAVAGFSNLRYMKKGGPIYRSAELIRFATLTGFTVTGGFTKLLKHFIDTYQPNDIMSYADRDWSQGGAYSRAGFTLIEITAPAKIWLNKATLERYFAHRLPLSSADTAEVDYIKIFNTGNLKYILYLLPQIDNH